MRYHKKSEIKSQCDTTTKPIRITKRGKKMTNDNKC